MTGAAREPQIQEGAGQRRRRQAQGHGSGGLDGGLELRLWNHEVPSRNKARRASNHTKQDGERRTQAETRRGETKTESPTGGHKATDQKRNNPTRRENARTRRTCQRGESREENARTKRTRQQGSDKAEEHKAARNTSGRRTTGQQGEAANDGYQQRRAGRES